MKHVDKANKRFRPISFCVRHNKFYSIARSILGTIISVVILGFGANIISSRYPEWSVPSKAIFWIVTVLIVAVFTLCIILFDRKVLDAKLTENKEREKKEKLLNCAVNHLVQENSEQQERIIKNNSQALTKDHIAEICYLNIKNTVDACYRSILDYHKNENNAKEILDDAFNLTVNFMTESYIHKLDGSEKPAITVAAWKNFNNDREPGGRACLFTEKGYYGNSEAAKMYNGKYPKELQIIPDTKDLDINEDDKEKTKSMVIAPVLSHGNKLIGTLVVHCNEKDFFNNESKEFLNNLLKIFTEPIKNEKLLLDALMQDKALLNAMLKGKTDFRI